MLKKKNSTKTDTVKKSSSLVTTHSKSQMDKIRKRFQETGGGESSGINWANVKEGEGGRASKATFHILPPHPKAEGFFYYTVSQHYGFTIGGRNRALDCPESVDGEHHGKCPICKFIAKLKQSSKSHQTKADRMRANRRYFMNVIDRNDEEGLVRIFGTNKKCIEFILDHHEDTGKDITSPNSKYDLSITRRGRGLRTRYSYNVRKAEPVTIWPDDLYDLANTVSNWMSYEDMVGYIKDNYEDELKEVGLTFKSVKNKTEKKKGKKYDEDEEEDVEEKNDGEEYTEDEEDIEDDEDTNEDEEDSEEDSDDEDEEEE